MLTFYLICFILGVALSILSVLGGFGHLHIGHAHFGHIGHTAHTTHISHGHHGPRGLSSINGFTITAFLCWFGAAGYLLYRYTGLIAVTVFLGAVLSGLIGAAILWVVLFKLLLPRERVLNAEDTEMPGVVARVSNTIRDNGGIGEIIFSQTGARRAFAACSEDGTLIPRGTEVVVIRSDRGIAYVRSLHEAPDTWAEHQSPAG
jgi:hypothetical protein